ncbi:MAG: hypothetical protein IH945_00180 [Armatimonadetes bacterium]|nr:hypothetical protein [Armatimonadota bacterium]
MFSAILLVVAIGANQQQEPLFPRLFPVPTGQNGMEEYVRAMDLSKQLDIEYARNMVYRLDQLYPIYEMQSEEFTKTARVLALVAIGNNKPFFPVTSGDDFTMFPLQAGMKQLAKLLAQHAEVQFARGQVNQGFDTLLEGLALSERVKNSGGYMDRLVGDASNSILISTLDDHLHAMSLPAAEKVLARIPPPVFPAKELPTLVRREMAQIRRRMLLSSEGRLKAMDLLTGGLAEFPPIEKKFILEAIQSFQTSGAELLHAAEDLASLPEIEWFRESNKLRVVNVENELAAATLSGDLHFQLAQRIALGRTVTRLLRLNAHVMRFRWLHDRYPTTLEELDVGDEADDPLSGQRFYYRPKIEGFELYTLGNASIARTGMRLSGRIFTRNTLGPPSRED